MSEDRREEFGRSRAPLEAAEWLLEHESPGELPDERLHAWGAWLDDPANRAEYASLVRLSRDIRRLARPGLPGQAELLGDSWDPSRLPADIAPRTVGKGFGGMRAGARATMTNTCPDHSSIPPGWSRAARLAPSIAAAGAAGLLLVLALALLLKPAVRTRPAAEGQPARVFATRAGEQQDFVLTDGSRMTLAADSSALVRITASGRAVVLTRGEGMFRVRHDPARAFLVCAGQACVTAVGTVFDVHLYSSRVHIWVAEGSVEVTPLRPPESVGRGGKTALRPGRLRLWRGEEVSYDANGDASDPRPADLHVASAWTEGALIYHGRPLAEVIEDVQRYTARPILLDPNAADLRFSGSVIQQHVDQWLRGLPAIFPVDIIDCRTLAGVMRGGMSPGPSQGPPSPPPKPMPSSCATGPERILIRSRDVP